MPVVGMQAGVQVQPKVLYQADQNYIQSMKSIRHHMHHVCRQHANQIVQVQTIDGQVVTGRILGCDRGLFYLGYRIIMEQDAPSSEAAKKPS